MKQSYSIFILCVTLLFQTVYGVPQIKLPDKSLLFERKYEDIAVSSNGLGLTSEGSDVYFNSSEIPTNESFSQTDQSDSTLTLGEESHLVENSTNTSNTHKVTTLTEIFGNESQSPSPVDPSSSKSTISSDGAGGTLSTHSVSSTQKVNAPVSVTEKGTEEDEPESVARGKPPGTESVNVTMPETGESIYEKTLALISDTYTLSILVPVAAGIIFASTILITIAICRCARRQCRRRRLRKKVLPDSVKHLRPSDRARLLAESSDEEF